jgi:hypothetical protein
LFIVGHKRSKTPVNQLQAILMWEICCKLLPHIEIQHVIMYKCKQGLKLLFWGQILYLFGLAGQFADYL